MQTVTSSSSRMLGIGQAPLQTKVKRAWRQPLSRKESTICLTAVKVRSTAAITAQLSAIISLETVVNCYHLLKTTRITREAALIDIKPRKDNLRPDNHPSRRHHQRSNLRITMIPTGNVMSTTVIFNSSQCYTSIREISLLRIIITNSMRHRRSTRVVG